MQVEVNVKCMETNFGGHGLSSFGDFTPFFPFKNGQNFPSDHELYIVHGGQIIESAQQNMHIYYNIK